MSMWDRKGATRMMKGVSKKARAEAHLISGPTPRHVGRTFLLALLALLLTAGSTVAIGYYSLQNNINQTNVNDLVGGDSTPPPIDQNEGRPLNILVLGSDTREGQGMDSEVEGMRADTTMLFHVSADRSRVDVVSLPRDLLVEIPSCTVRTGENLDETFETSPSSQAMFNAAFSYGGQTGDVPSAAACSMKTVEKMTGIKLDGYVVLNFKSFEQVVDAIGGVPMYFEEAVNDPDAGLSVPAGCRLLDGDQALGLARARKTLGDGSDISRIGRQQELVTAMINEVLSKNLLTNMPSLYKVLDAATANLDTSQGLGDIPTLGGLANSLRNISMDNVQFVTTPFAYAGARVTATDEADILWEAIAQDKAFTSSEDAYGNITIEIVKPTTAAPAESEPASEETEEPPATQETEESAEQATTAPAAEPTTSAPVCTKENAQG